MSDKTPISFLDTRAAELKQRVRKTWRWVMTIIFIASTAYWIYQITDLGFWKTFMGWCTTNIALYIGSFMGRVRADMMIDMNNTGRGWSRTPDKPQLKLEDKEHSLARAIKRAGD